MITVLVRLVPLKLTKLGRSVPPTPLIQPLPHYPVVRSKARKEKRQRRYLRQVVAHHLLTHDGHGDDDDDGDDDGVAAAAKR